MVAAARLNPTPTPNPTALSAPPPPTPAARPTPTESPRDPASRDTFAVAPTTSPTTRAATTTAPGVQGDPELARQARTQMQSAQVGTDRNIPGRVRTDPGDLNTGDVSARQAAFRTEMQTATGTAPQNPPTEAEVRSYFRTLRSGPPSAAVSACERYQDAYARHSGGDHSYNSVDTTYATDPARGRPRILAGAEAAEREHRAGRNTTSIQNDAPNNFAEANAQRGSDGRARMDCEGFAVTSSELLREAGFSQRQAVGTFPDGSAHAAAIVSRGGHSWVMSNGDAYPVTGRGDAGTRAALDRAFDATVSDGVPATYYTGRSQDEANTRETLNLPAGRISH